MVLINAWSYFLFWLHCRLLSRWLFSIKLKKVSESKAVLLTLTELVVTPAILPHSASKKNQFACLVSLTSVCILLTRGEPRTKCGVLQVWWAAHLPAVSAWEQRMAPSLQELIFPVIKEKSEVGGTDEEIQELFVELQDRECICKCL